MPRIRYLLLTVTIFLLPVLTEAAEETIVLEDSRRVKVLFFEPDNDQTKPLPLAVLIPGGTGDEFMARAQFWLGQELVDRGWAIAVPISPDNHAFDDDNLTLIPAVTRVLQARPHLQSEKSLLIGLSSGGSAALAVAATQPEIFSGVIAIPGLLKADTTIVPLNGLPVYLRIGERDSFLWNRQLNSMATRLTDAGAEVNAALVPDARHIFTIDWEELEPWLKGL